jgi:hypothetical protein
MNVLIKEISAMGSFALDILIFGSDVKYVKRRKDMRMVPTASSSYMLSSFVVIIILCIVVSQELPRPCYK